MNNKQFYYSNCFIEALKEWVKHPKNIQIKKYGSWSYCLRKGKFPHFYWKDKKTGQCFDFRRFRKDYPNDSFLNQLWFKGFKYQLKFGMM